MSATDDSTKGRILIVEDEPLIAADLANQLRKANFSIIDCLESAEEVITYLKKNESIDIIIMDIRLEGDMDGIDAAQHISNNYSIPIIFLSSNTDDSTFKRSKIATPHAFLSKPFRINDVIRSIELAISQKEPDQSDDQIEYLQDRIFIKSNNTLERVLFKDILYFEANGAYTNLVTDDRTFLLSQTLKKSEEKIDGKQFIKVHRSFIINVQQVAKISEGYIFLKDIKIPVSRSYKDKVINLFKTL